MSTFDTFNELLATVDTVVKNLDKTPYCTGTFPWDTSKSTLFYKSSEVESRFLNFPAADSQLESLFSASQPATFGLNQKDVLDESYRKAGKMDVGSFSMQFSPHDEGLVSILAEILLRDRFEPKDIKVELYKLNVYGPGGFFKAHVDTPRGTAMVGSLVVILPTAHKGGSLILRHDGREWTFDSAEAVDTTSSPQAAFIAFFSDIEHEVKPVTSGYRVTLTYNLYVKKDIKANSAVVSKDVENELELKEALARLLENSAFVDGGMIGFGLTHKYPFDMDTTVLSDIKEYLKGSDAAIKRACDLLSLDVAIKAVYLDGDPDYPRAVLLDKFVDFREHSEIGNLMEHLQEYNGGRIVVDHKEDFWVSDYSMPIVWVRPLASTNKFKDTYMAHGNEATLDYVYGEVCLIAKVPPAQRRVGLY